MTENSDEPIEEATACGSSDSGQLASSASWHHDDEVDDGYDDLLASIGRTEDQDRRIAVHELSHFFINRLLGTSSISEVTIDPAGDYEGLCRGARRSAFTKEGVVGADAADIRKILQPIMPEPGQDRTPKADVFQSVLDACTELMAGEVGEGMFFDEPCFASDDRRQAIELASLVCRSPEAIEQFLSFCERQAFDLLSEHVTVLMSMQIILRMHRTMSGSELDEAIASVLAHQALARERHRREQWQRTVERAAAFERQHVIVRTR
ncbi:hypothetical protein [Bradyrhizobium sp. RDI18]|uniref:hypothetical protein n=1 Tax=Bradyrhizobium sp. RDI18 TaxID=3367400 RepID=UPI003724C093